MGQACSADDREEEVEMRRQNRERTRRKEEARKMEEEWRARNQQTRMAVQPAHSSVGSNKVNPLWMPLQTVSDTMVAAGRISNVREERTQQSVHGGRSVKYVTTTEREMNARKAMSQLKSMNAFEERSSHSSLQESSQSAAASLSSSSSSSSSSSDFYHPREKQEVLHKIEARVIPHRRSPDLYKFPHLELIPEDAPQRLYSTYEEL
ncbi:hypothetical protein GUITHDRAFT_146087 [Guillardia theta CCMP2712]|uniref:Uncharacterized protein n=1 Tax=Guillardia theta (strain CCMP2712) TaxID=905079 RepID=L1IIG6_GUITC|nr:hypothetical protein GUITHDRAFT_146087 [Guillardia theta CCMP2712]EKX36048.1 hypothetical protein GUITHDRAFT_146087 [Guillardia theta CCMP2712]|eukprot:XP_005823028.1 hypothetical protein GUITHDRAFT_146087 [Guillardia theta CCMP2712]